MEAGVAALRRALRSVGAALCSRTDGLPIAGNEMKVAPALAGYDRIGRGNGLRAAPVADFVVLAAFFGCRCGASDRTGQVETRACQQDGNVDTQARHDHPPRFRAVTSRMTIVRASC